jgi:hypothetical protein
MLDISYPQTMNKPVVFQVGHLDSCNSLGNTQYLAREFGNGIIYIPLYIRYRQERYQEAISNKDYAQEWQRSRACLA